MRILYCDLSPKITVKGHRYFDVKWTHFLSNIAEVTLLCLDKDWYENVNKDIEMLIFDFNEIIQKHKWLEWKIWNKGNFRRLCLKEHFESNYYIKNIIALSKEKKFDYIVIGNLDFISYLFFRKRLLNASKLVLINHSTDSYNKGILKKIFARIKNDFIHIVMEEDAVNHLIDIFRIKKEKIAYIPHMLNNVNIKPTRELQSYDVVGISNSNDDNEIQKIIDMEKNEHYFEKTRQKAIFRSKNLEYDSYYLKVFKDMCGLSFDEYYSYILNAKVIVLPFSINFGLRSSGTIMDAFSHNIPVIGNAFTTLVQYNRYLPNICKIYSTMDELKKGLNELIDRNDEQQLEYMHFQELHSDSFILKQIKKTFI